MTAWHGLPGKLVLLALSVLLAGSIAEIVLRLADIAPEQYAVYPPGFHMVTNPDTSLMHGIAHG